MISSVGNYDLQNLPATKWEGLTTFQQGTGGHYGTYTNFQSDVNNRALGPHIDSNRDDHSFSDSNTYSTREISIDMSNFIPGDVNTHEIVFSVNITPRIEMDGRGQLSQCEHIMGLSKLNEWLKTSDFGRELGKHKNSSILAEHIAFRGVVITSMEQENLQKHQTKSVTIVFNGRTTIPDITAWSRSTLNFKNRDTTRTFDHLSICFRRVVHKNPLMDLTTNVYEFPHYWQAIPQKHYTQTPPKVMYSSMNYMIKDEHEFQGHYIRVGIVRSILNGNAHGKHNIAQKAYNYLFNKDGRSLQHISDYNSLPYLELFINNTHLLH